MLQTIWSLLPPCVTWSTPHFPLSHSLLQGILPFICSLPTYSVRPFRHMPFIHVCVSQSVAGDRSADGTGQMQVLVLKGQPRLLVQFQKSQPAWFDGKYTSLFLSFLSCLEPVLGSLLTLCSPAVPHTSLSSHPL